MHEEVHNYVGMPLPFGNSNRAIVRICNQKPPSLLEFAFGDSEKAITKDLLRLSVKLFPCISRG